MGPDQGLASDIRPDSNSLRGPAITKFTQTGGQSLYIKTVLKLPKTSLHFLQVPVTKGYFLRSRKKIFAVKTLLSLHLLLLYLQRIRQSLIETRDILGLGFAFLCF